MDINIGETLRKLRMEQGYSEFELSELLKIPQASISSYENETAMPPVDVLISYALVFEISMDDLCGISVEPVQKLIEENKILLTALVNLENSHELCIQNLETCEKLNNAYSFILQEHGISLEKC